VHGVLVIKTVRHALVPDYMFTEQEVGGVQLSLLPFSPVWYCSGVKGERNSFEYIYANIPVVDSNSKHLIPVGNT
jgi:hypothetical protein